MLKKKKKKRQLASLRLFDFKTYYKATIVRQGNTGIKISIQTNRKE